MITEFAATAEFMFLVRMNEKNNINLKFHKRGFFDTIPLNEAKAVVEMVHFQSWLLLFNLHFTLEQQSRISNTLHINYKGLTHM